MKVCTGVHAVQDWVLSILVQPVGMHNSPYCFDEPAEAVSFEAFAS